MSKPLKMWCIRTPRGRLLNYAIRDTKRKVKDLWSPFEWGHLMQKGHTVVRVTVEEVK